MVDRPVTYSISNLISSLTAEVPRGNGLCYLFTYRRILLFTVHQPRGRHTPGVYASRRCSSETSKADFDTGKYFGSDHLSAVEQFPDFFTSQIAKMLQNLANKPSYAKEAYMITLNPFVENNKARINQFLNNLCEVGDFYDTLEVCGYSVGPPSEIGG